MSAVLKSIVVAGALSIAIMASSSDADAWGGRYYYYDYYYDDPYVLEYPYASFETDYVYVEPAPVIVYDDRPYPWTPEWYDYCASRYRSFDPASGTFQPYHGRRRLCR